jgi:hypothetical protein
MARNRLDLLPSMDDVEDDSLLRRGIPGQLLSTLQDPCSDGTPNSRSQDLRHPSDNQFRQLRLLPCASTAGQATRRRVDTVLSRHQWSAKFALKDRR